MGMKPARGLSLLACLALLAFGLCLPATAQIPGWETKAFGDDTQGSASVDSNGVWTVKAQSGDTWERDDHFFIVYKSLTGDGSVTTRLLNAEEGAEWSRIGLMMRDDLESPAAQVFQFYMTAGGVHGIEANFRGVTGDRMAKDQKAGNDGGRRGPAKPPVWFKIERRGDRMVGYLSEDGAFWIPVTRSHQFPMADPIVAGVFNCSHPAADSPLTATFDGKVTDVSPKLLKSEEAAPLQPDPVIALGNNNAVLLSWEPVKHGGKDADNYVVYRAKVGDANFTKITDPPLPGNQTSFRDDTIKNGEQAQYRVTTIVKVGPAADKVLESRTFPGSEGLLSYVTGAANPPIPIAGRDFFATVLDGGGNQPVTDKPGSAAIDNNVVTLRASGWNLADRIDGGHQLVTPITGDFTFTARVNGPPTAEAGDVSDNARFGIAVRESTQANSRYAAMLITPTRGIRAPHRRLFNDGWTEDLGPNEDTPTFPIFFRIQRRKDEIKMFTSADGKTFKEYGDPATTALPGVVQNVYVGFIGTSGDVEQVALAKFEQITLVQP